MIPMSLSGVTYRAPASIFPQAEGGGGGGDTEVFYSTVDPFTAGTTPTGSSGVYYYRNMPIAEPFPDIATPGKSFMYVWNGSAWEFWSGFSWANTYAWGSLLPDHVFQVHYEVSGSGSGGYLFNAEFAPSVSDNEVWMTW
jgi:hypothetical protein